MENRDYNFIPENSGMSGNENQVSRPVRSAPAPSATVPDNRQKNDSPKKSSKSNKNGPENKRGEKALLRVIIAIALLAALGVAVLTVRYFNLKSIAETADALMSEHDYSQAYLIADKYSARATRQNVALSAIEYYIDAGDYKQAYVYAELIDEPDAVTDGAIAEILRLGKDAVGSDAFSVARKSTNDQKFDNAITELSESFIADHDYFRALDILTYLRNSQNREDLSTKCFLDGALYYLNDLRNYDGAIKFISEYCTINSSSDDVDDEAARAIIDKLKESGEVGSAIILSNHYGIDSSSFEVSPGDIGVRSVFHLVYPLMTETQKRAFHSTPLGYYKEPYVVKNGAIDKTDITDAVSAACHEFRTAVMHEDGHVSMISNNGHNETDNIPEDVKGIKVVCGAHHTVILKSDGTCAAFGANDRGQCNVSEWTDIEEIAAGRYFTLGLKSDGTVVACGYDNCGQCDVEKYRNVVEIGACDQTSVFLFADGTVHIQGYSSMGIADANDFKDVVEIRCGDNFVAARLKDGSFRIADGTAEGSAGSEEALAGCKDFCAGSASIAYIDTEDNLKYTGDGAPTVNKYYESKNK